MSSAAKFVFQSISISSNLKFHVLLLLHEMKKPFLKIPYISIRIYQFALFAKIKQQISQEL